MDNKWLVSTIFIIVELVSVVTAGPVRSSVSCVSSVHPDGSASYRLSQPPPYHRCDTTWEDGNRIVIAVGSESAVGSERNASLVTHLTNQSIGLNVCLQRVTAEVECLSERISYKAECRANCSARTTKGPPLTCLGGWCPEPWKFVLGVAGAVGAAVLSYLVYRLWLSKRKGRQSFPAVAETHHDGTAEDLGSYSAVKTSIS